MSEANGEATPSGFAIRQMAMVQKSCLACSKHFLCWAGSSGVTGSPSAVARKAALRENVCAVWVLYSWLQGYTLVLNPNDSPSRASPSQTHNHASAATGGDVSPSQRSMAAAIATAKAAASETTTQTAAISAPAPSPSHLYPARAPSFLGQLYMAAHGPDRLVAGASRSYGWSPEEALLVCEPRHRSFKPRWGASGLELPVVTTASGFGSGHSDSEGEGDGDEGPAPGPRLAQETPEAVAAAAAELHRAGTAVWAPLQDWNVVEIK